MGLEEFKQERFQVDTEDSDARPRVPEAVHQDVKEFTDRSGTTIPKSYKLLIHTVLSNDDLLCEVISRSSDDVGELSDYHKDLLDDIAQLSNVLGEFPSRDDINSDSLCFGFPIYINAFGSKERLIECLKEEHSDIADNIDL